MNTKIVNIQSDGCASDPFAKHLERVSETIRDWPEWKQQLASRILSAPKVGCALTGREPISGLKSDDSSEK